MGQNGMEGRGEGIERGSRGRREGRGLRERNIGERIERERGIDGRGSGARITSK